MDKECRSTINERMSRYGISSLTDEEILSMLTGVPSEKLKDIIKEHGLSELIKYTALMELTKQQETKLKLIFSMVKRINMSEYIEKIHLNSSEKSGDYFIKELQFYDKEVFSVALLNSKNKLIKSIIVSEGTVNEAPVYIREIIKLILSYNATAVIVAHNHLGGSLSPSNEDISLTNRLYEALKLIKVSLLDHIIVAGKSYSSLANLGIIKN